MTPCHHGLPFVSAKLPIIALTIGIAVALLGTASSAFAARARKPRESRPAAPPFVQFDLNIPGVNEQMLDSGYWIDRIADPDREIMTRAEIERYNRRSTRECEKLKDLRSFRRVLTGKEVREAIAGISVRPKKKMYQSGLPVQDEYYAGLERALALEAIPGKVMVRFGITVKRTEMRTFPTPDRIFSEPDDYEFDRFAETALYPVEPVAILHESADGKWYFAQAYNYLAWIPAADVALTDRITLFEYLDARDFLVVTGKWVFTGFNPFQPDISELQLDMGVRIPLASRDEIPKDIKGQHPAGNYVVKLPARGAAGRLEWRLGLISRADDVHVGYLPFTRRNIITQAFKFLGQRYGWGGMFNTRDCSSFIMDNFRSMGVILPRNAGEQGKLALAVRHPMPETMDLEARRRLFESIPPATPVYMDGHAMLYLWKQGDDYFILHDFAGFNVPGKDGKLERIKMRSVLVTPLLATWLASGKRYMEGLYAACEFRLEKN